MRESVAQDSADDTAQPVAVDHADPAPRTDATTPRPREIGGPKGPEPTRYGDWERKGRCVDF